MKHIRYAVSLLATAAFFTLGACADRLTTEPSNSPGANPTKAALLDSISRSLAMGLADPDLRQLLLQAMRRSVVSEHKLVLQDFVTTDAGLKLIDGAATRSGIPNTRLLQMLNELPRLDLYVLDRRHRLTWRGTENYAVAGTLTQIGPELYAFAKNGLRIRVDLLTLPSRVLIGLHPEDPKGFRIDPQADVPGEVVQDASDGEQTITYVDELSTGEVYVHHVRTLEEARLPRGRIMARYYTNTADGSKVAFSGGDAGILLAREFVSTYACDHFCGALYTGEQIEIEFRTWMPASQDFQRAQFNIPAHAHLTVGNSFPGFQLRNEIPGAGQTVIIDVWEEDAGQDDHWISVSLSGSNFSNQVFGGPASSRRCHEAGDLEFVGENGDPAHLCSPALTWREINVWFGRQTAQGSLIDDGLDTNEGYGFFDLEGGSGSGGPPTGMSVSIVGNSAIQSGLGCQWYANVTGGTGPYVYSWRIDGALQQEQSNTLSYTNTGSAFKIFVDVIDQNENRAMTDRQVTIDPNSYCT